MAGENWLVGWGYRKSHVVNAQAGAGTLYQTLIKVYYGSGTDGTETVNGIVAGKVYCNNYCRTDLGDLRFTDDDGSTQLDYWIEEKVDSNYAMVWIEVADSLESNNVTIYIYYGKSDATYPFGDDQTQMNATFPFADHFYGTVLNTDKWSGDTANVVLLDSIMTLTTDSTAVRILQQNVTNYPRFTFPLATRTSIKMHPRGTSMTCLFGIWDGTLTNTADFRGLASSDAICCVKAGSSTSLASDWTRNAWTLWDLYWQSGSVNFKEYGTDCLQSPITLTIPIVDLGVFIRAGVVSGIAIAMDYVFVRKFVSPEPTHGAWGSEETPPVEIKPASSIVPLMQGMDLI